MSVAPDYFYAQKMSWRCNKKVEKIILSERGIILCGESEVLLKKKKETKMLVMQMGNLLY